MDYAKAIAHLQAADPMLAGLIEQVGPCGLAEPPDDRDLLQSLARTIIAQQLSTKAAATIYRRFLDLYAGQPDAGQILQSADDELRRVGLSRSKVAYVKGVAQAVREGLPTLADLNALDDGEIITTLTQLKGIGPWSAQMVLIFRLRRPDVLPTEDLGIRTGMRRLYGLAALPNKAEMEAIAQPWQPYRSVAAWYLWRSLETMPP